MIDKKIGYPSLLYLMNTISFLGFCSKFEPEWEEPKESKEINKKVGNSGERLDFMSFNNNYLGKINDSYKELGELLFRLVRHKLSHNFFTYNYVTTEKISNHLKIQEGEKNHCPHLWISVIVFFEDTKKAIELMYKDLSEDNDKAKQFVEKQEMLHKWNCNLQKNYLERKSLEKRSKRDYPEDYGGVSGSPYSPMGQEKL